jgi:hypothetical protein
MYDIFICAESVYKVEPQMLYCYEYVYTQVRRRDGTFEDEKR